MSRDRTKSDARESRDAIIDGLDELRSYWCYGPDDVEQTRESIWTSNKLESIDDALSDLLIYLYQAGVEFEEEEQ